MSGFSRRIASTMVGILLSVSALAAPIDIASHNVAAPVAITTLDLDDTAMTHKDFVAAKPNVVVLDTATPVPIDSKAFDLLAKQAIEEAANATDVELQNHPVMQNKNCERMSS